MSECFILYIASAGNASYFCGRVTRHRFMLFFRRVTAVFFRKIFPSTSLFCVTCHKFLAPKTCRSHCWRSNSPLSAQWSSSPVPTQRSSSTHPASGQTLPSPPSSHPQASPPSGHLPPILLVVKLSPILTPPHPAVIFHPSC